MPARPDPQRDPPPPTIHALISYRDAGVTGTLNWSTLNTLDAKLELDENIAKGLKAEVLTTLKPDTGAYGAKLNTYFKQPAFHVRAFFDLLKGPTANVDAVIGHEGFVVGGEAGYDVQKAAITRYSAAIGYQHAVHSASVTATNNMSVFAAAYYHRVNAQVEAGAKAVWDSKNSGNVGLEVATKYLIDPTSFAKVRTFDLRNMLGVYHCLHSAIRRPRLTTGALPRSPTTSRSSQESRLDSAPPSIHRSSTRAAIRLAPALLLRDERHVIKRVGRRHI